MKIGDTVLYRGAHTIPHRKTERRWGEEAVVTSVLFAWITVRWARGGVDDPCLYYPEAFYKPRTT